MDWKELNSTQVLVQHHHYSDQFPDRRCHPRIVGVAHSCHRSIRLCLHAEEQRFLHQVCLFAASSISSLDLVSMHHRLFLSFSPVPRYRTELTSVNAAHVGSITTEQLVIYVLGALHNVFSLCILVSFFLSNNPKFPTAKSIKQYCWWVIRPLSFPSPAVVSPVWCSVVRYLLTFPVVPTAGKAERW